MDVDAQPPAATGDGEQDGLARLVPDGVGHQFAGEQDRGLLVDGNPPRPDRGADPATGFGGRRRSRGQADLAPV
jgi:hypothetical protein